MRAARAGAEWDVDIGKPRLDVGDAVRVGCGLGLMRADAARSRSPARTVSIRLSWPPGASCATVPMLAWRGTPIDPGLGAEFAQDQLQQGGFADAVAPDEADLVAFGKRHSGVVQEQAAADPVGEVIDMQHGRAH